VPKAARRTPWVWHQQLGKARKLLAGQSTQVYQRTLFPWQCGSTVVPKRIHRCPNEGGHADVRKSARSARM